MITIAVISTDSEYYIMSKTLLALALSLGFINSAIAATDFLNVSYDPTRELYQDSLYMTKK